MNSKPNILVFLAIKLRIALLLILITSCISCSNKNNENLPINITQTNADSVFAKLLDSNDIPIQENTWVLSNLFYKDVIELTRLNPKSKETFDIITFKNNGSLKYDIHNPIPGCGVGVTFIDTTSNWSVNTKNGNLILTLNGDIGGSGNFIKQIEYTVDSIAYNKLTLRLFKIHYEK